jgi:hypothetical protein
MKRFDAKHIGADSYPIAGCQIFGNVVVAGNQTAESGTVNYSVGEWTGGAKSDMFGHIIIGETSTTYSTTSRPTGNGTGVVSGSPRLRFFKSEEKTEASFLALANKIPTAHPFFDDAYTADTWLKNNGFYSSFGEADSVRSLGVSTMYSTRSDAMNDSSPGTTVYQEDGYVINQYTKLYTQQDVNNSKPSGSFFVGDSNSSNYYKISPQGGGSFYTCRIDTSGNLTEFAEGYNDYL